jgi:hypothetical protein
LEKFDEPQRTTMELKATLPKKYARLALSEKRGLGTRPG